MRILIVDDTEINHLSADRTLTEHEVVHVRTQEEASHLLQSAPTYHWVKEEAELRGIDWDTAKANFRPARFDAVLLDLFMPPDRHANASEAASGLIPCGLVLAMLAAKLEQVRFILVATATNHHDGTLSRMLIDGVGRTPFRINATHVQYREADMVPIDGISCPKCQGAGTMPNQKPCMTCLGRKIPLGKDWGGMLADLMQKTTSP